MRQAMRVCALVADKHPETRFVLPMHRNPVVREVVDRCARDLPNVLLVEPLTTTSSLTR